MLNYNVKNKLILEFMKTTVIELKKMDGCIENVYMKILGPLRPFKMVVKL